MPVGLYLNPPALTEAIYFDVTEKVQATGPWPPEGLLHHSCFNEGPDRPAIYEVWETEEAMQRYGVERLGPVFEEVGFDAGMPAIVSIVNLIQP